jgi:signal transduction histidine kinase
LVNNAIKFTKEGKISISTTKEKEFLNIIISDTGIGIKEDEIPIIFKEFKQLSEGTLKDFQGTGLGLSISQKYIEHLNGKLDVKSKFGVGSDFIVKFPI